MHTHKDLDMVQNHLQELIQTIIIQGCGSGSGRIRTFLVGSGSERLVLINDSVSTFLVCVKAINT
jgi:hypothetical protein